MSHPAAFTAPFATTEPSSGPLAGARAVAAGARAWQRGAFALSALALLACGGLAQAQMVPRGGHFLHQGQAASVTTARLPWGGVPAAATDTDEARGSGLALKGQPLWARWEGRVGAVMDRQADPLHDSFVLAQPAQGGLRMRSVHVLSDYYVEGGFRATVGLVSGEAGQAWWSSGDQGGGVNISLQQLDNLGTPGIRLRDNSLPQANPYIGAGYSTRINRPHAIDSWRFNADFGLINTTSSGRLADALQGDRPLDDVVRGLRFRPVVKVSVGYAF